MENILPRNADRAVNVCYADGAEERRSRQKKLTAPFDEAQGDRGAKYVVR